jgi:hypothetical protein
MESREYVLRVIFDIIRRYGKNIPEETKKQIQELSKAAAEQQPVFEQLAKTFVSAVEAQKTAILSSKDWQKAFKDMTSFVAQEREAMISAEEAHVKGAKGISDATKLAESSVVDYTDAIEKLEAQAFEKELAGQTDEAKKLTEQAEELRNKQLLVSRSTETLQKAWSDELADMRASTYGTVEQEIALKKLPPLIYHARDEYTKFKDAWVLPKEPIDITTEYITKLIKLGAANAPLLKNQIEQTKRTSEWYDELSKTYGISTKYLPSMYSAFKNVYAQIYGIQNVGKGFTSFLDTIKSKGVSVEELPDYFWAVVKSAAAAKREGMNLSTQLDKLIAGEWGTETQKQAQNAQTSLKEVTKDVSAVPKVKLDMTQVESAVNQLDALKEILSLVHKDFQTILAEMPTPNVTPVSTAVKSVTSMFDGAGQAVKRFLADEKGLAKLPDIIPKKPLEIKWMTPAETYFTRIVDYVPDTFKKNMIESWDSVKKYVATFPTWPEQRAKFVEALKPTGIPPKAIWKYAEKTYFEPVKGAKPPTVPPAVPKLPVLPPETIRAILEASSGMEGIATQAKKAGTGTKSLNEKVAKSYPDVVKLTRGQEALVHEWLAQDKAMNAVKDEFAGYLSNNAKVLGLTDDQIAAIDEYGATLAKQWIKQQEAAGKETLKFAKQMDRTSSRIGFFGWVTMYTGRFVINTLKDIWSMIDNVMKVGADWEDNIGTLAVTLALMSATGQETTETYGYLSKSLDDMVAHGLEMQAAYMELHSVFISIQSTLAYMLVPAFEDFANTLATVAQQPAFTQFLQQIANIVSSSIIPMLLSLLQTVVSLAPVFMDCANAFLFLLKVIAPFAPILMTFGLLLWAISPVLKVLSAGFWLYGQMVALSSHTVTMASGEVAVAAAGFTLAGHEIIITARMVQIAVVGAFAIVGAVVAYYAMQSMQSSSDISGAWKKAFDKIKKTTAKAATDKTLDKMLTGDVYMTKQQMAKMQEAVAKGLEGYINVTEESMVATADQWKAGMSTVVDSTGNIMYYINEMTGAVYDSAMDQIGWWDETTGAITDSANTQIGTLDNVTKAYIGVDGSVGTLKNSIDTLSTTISTADWSIDTSELEKSLSGVSSSVGSLQTVWHDSFVLMEGQTVASVALMVAKINPLAGAIVGLVGALIILKEEGISLNLRDRIRDFVNSLTGASEETKRNQKLLDDLMDQLQGPWCFSHVAAYADIFTAALKDSCEQTDESISSLERLRNSLLTMCFKHAAPMAEAFGGVLSDVNAVTEESIGKIGTLTDTLKRMSPVGVAVPAVAAGGIGGGGGEIGPITVYVYFTGPISAEVDLAKIPEFVDKGITQALLRRRR